MGSPQRSVPHVSDWLRNVGVAMSVLTFTSMTCLAGIAAGCYWQYSTTCCKAAESAGRPSGRYCSGTWCPDPTTANPAITDFREAYVGEKGKDDYSGATASTCSWTEATCDGINCGTAVGTAHSSLCYNYSTTGATCNGTVTPP